MSEILDRGKTPEEWATIFAERGMTVSARRLRQDARTLGACAVYGKAMILLPEHIDQILMTKGRARPKARPARPAHPVDTTDAALAHLARCRKRKR